MDCPGIKALSRTFGKVSYSHLPAEPQLSLPQFDLKKVMPRFLGNSVLAEYATMVISNNLKFNNIFIMFDVSSCVVLIFLFIAKNHIALITKGRKKTC